MKLARRLRWILWPLLVLLLGIAGSCVLLTLPTETRQGVNYRVTVYRIPAYVKILDFLQRHYQYELLMSRLCAGKASPVDCVLTIFDWTHDAIVPTPAQLPVIDDHPLHIIIRGYGQNDQMADVFVTLSVYAGVPAFFKSVRELRYGRFQVALSFAFLNGKWVPFDVTNHVVFRRRDGALAGIEELVDDPSLVDAQVRAPLPGGLPYSAFISRQTLMPFVVPHPLRAELQQPWPRIRYTLRRAVGWERQ